VVPSSVLGIRASPSTVESLLSTAKSVGFRFEDRSVERWVHSCAFARSRPECVSASAVISARVPGWRDRLLVVHELVHVAQYERSGGILPFLRRYLFECLTVGYSASPLELEAIAVTARVCAEYFTSFCEADSAFRPPPRFGLTA
jgi:hypothetical protein